MTNLQQLTKAQLIAQLEAVYSAPAGQAELHIQRLEQTLIRRERELSELSVQKNALLEKHTAYKTAVYAIAYGKKQLQTVGGYPEAEKLRDIARATLKEVE